MKDLVGTYREIDAGETWRMLQEKCALMGITRVADITHLDTIGTPTCMVVRPLSKSLSVSQGKGVSFDLARVSGVMEAAETFHAESFVPLGTMRDISKTQNDPQFVGIEELPIRPDASPDRFGHVRWVALENMTGAGKFVPRDMLDMDFTLGNPYAQHLFSASSNGLASGNSREEAMIHAICEMLERDQIAFWTVRSHVEFADAKLNPTRLDLRTVDDPDCMDVIAQCENSGIELFVWHTTQANCGVPCFRASVVDERAETAYPIRASGSGCHLDKRVAFLRAVTEAFQSRLTTISGSRDDKTWRVYRNDLSARLPENVEWLNEIRASQATLPWQDCPTIDVPKSSKAALAILLSRLDKMGLEDVLYLDLTQSDLAIPVVKMVIPGLEENVHTARYVAGRRMRAFAAEQSL